MLVPFRRAGHGQRVRSDAGSNITAASGVLRSGSKHRWIRAHIPTMRGESSGDDRYRDRPALDPGGVVLVGSEHSLSLIRAGCMAMLLRVAVLEVLSELHPEHAELHAA